ncbi:MAG: hypothetical protein H6869_08855 [Rhodospirillales bacterium]|nr:hypothetical protein [Rhodospirillales bacterium]
MKKPDYIPADYKRIKVVGSLSELFNAKFGGPDEINCIVYPRRLQQDFNKLALALQPLADDARRKTGRIRKLHYNDLKQLSAVPDPVLKEAVDAVIGDMDFPEVRRAREDFYKHAEFRIVYPGAYDLDEVIEDFHEDNIYVPEGRIIFFYAGATSEGARNEDVIKRSREGLINPQNDAYDLKPGAKAFRFQAGDVIRFAGNCQPGIKPFVHKAPIMKEHAPPRLLLTVDYIPKPD